MQNLGEILKQKRLQLGYSLEYVEDETKIRKYYIIALEENNYSQLPAKVYAVGFVKRYARLLELDENEVVKEFKRTAYRDESREKEEITTTSSRSEKLKVPVKNIITGIAFLLVFIWIGTYLVDYMVNNKTKQPATNPPISENNKNQAGKKAASKNNRQPAKMKGVNVVITCVNGKCWLRATLDGQRTSDSIIKTGEVKKLKANTKIALELGNAGAVKIQYNGKDLGFLGKPGDVVRTEFPTPPDTGGSNTGNEKTTGATTTNLFQ